MINSIGQQITNGEPNVKLVLFMPQTYVDLTPTSINLILNGEVKDCILGGSLASSSPGSLLEMQTVRPQPRFSESKSAC